MVSLFVPFLLKFKQIVILDHVADRIEILFDIHDSITRQKILPWDLWRQIHPRLDQIDIIEELFRIGTPYMVMLIILLLIDIHLNMQVTRLYGLQQKNPISEFKTAGFNTSDRNHFFYLKVLEKVNITKRLVGRGSNRRDIERLQKSILGHFKLADLGGALLQFLLHFLSH
jgi:hypothetical protein